MTYAKNAYNNASHNVSKTRQVVMLYEGMIRFVQQGKLALEEKRIEDRYNLLSKARKIVMALQSALDVEQGGEIAQTLDSYYFSIEMRILHVQMHDDANIYDSIIRDLKTMRDGWLEVDKVDAAETVLQEKEAEAAKSAPEIPATPVMIPHSLDGGLFVSA